jgi:hypothetical protein
MNDLEGAKTKAEAINVIEKHHKVHMKISCSQLIFN